MGQVMLRSGQEPEEDQMENCRALVGILLLGRGKSRDTITSGLEGAWTLTTPTKWVITFLEPFRL